MKLEFVPFKLKHNNIGKIIDTDNPNSKAIASLISRDNAKFIIDAVNYLNSKINKE